MESNRCKGTKDLSPADMAAFRFIEAAFRESCLKWGYEEVRTPTLEYLHLFTATGTLTPAMLGKVYSFLDWDGWSGERVVLRPDGTIPVARMYIDGMAGRKLAKLFYITNIFMFEGTGEQSRERWQGGVELIGASSPLADVELMLLAAAALERMGLPQVEIRLSHGGLIRGLLSELDLSPREQAEVFDSILDGEVDALAKVGSGRVEIDEALKLLIASDGDSASRLAESRDALLQALPHIGPALDDFIAVTEFLEKAGCRFHIDLASGRGFEYYTGVIFKLYISDEEVGGGGRYDALIPLMGGADVPASGFALYFDHLMDRVSPSASEWGEGGRVLVSIDPESVAEGLMMIDRLHESGLVAEMNIEGGEVDADWLINIRGEAPRFVITNMKQGEECLAATAEEALALLTR